VSQSPSSSYINSVTATPINQNQPEEKPNNEYQPETVQSVVSMLAACSRFEALSILRCPWRPPVSQLHKKTGDFGKNTIANRSGVTCLWDIEVDTPKVEAIFKSSLFDWINIYNLDAEYCSNSPEGQKFLAKCLANKKALRNALGITVKPDSHPIAIADKLLNRLGLGLSYSSRTERVKYYKLNEELATDPDRKAVFEALNLKWKNEVSKMTEYKPQQETQRMTEQNNFLYKNNGQSGNNKPGELAQNHVVFHTTDEWLTDENLANTANLLESCEDTEMLKDVPDFSRDVEKKYGSRLLIANQSNEIKMICALLM
jgi:hypothetical protein